MREYSVEEGRFILPAGAVDRTVNAFVLEGVVKGPFNLSVSRDVLGAGEDLAAYVTRQIKIIKGAIRGYKLIDKGEIAVNPEITGQAVYGSWKEGPKNIFQRQVAFLCQPEKVLICSATSASAFGDKENQLWQQWLASFQLSQKNRA